MFAFLLDSKLWLISNSIYHKPIQFIDVIGVFQNPTQVAQFKDVDGNSLYSDDGNYPVSRAMRDTLESIIITERIAPQAQAVSDVVNDSTDTLDGGELRS